MSATQGRGASLGHSLRPSSTHSATLWPACPVDSVDGPGASEEPGSLHVLISQGQRLLHTLFPRRYQVCPFPVQITRVTPLGPPQSLPHVPMGFVAQPTWGACLQFTKRDRPSPVASVWPLPLALESQ